LQQSWTAQAEPSSLIAATKLGCNRRWTVSKHDVKGVFLNAKLPEGRIVVVQPPQMWVDWGLVEKGVLWGLDKAVYGLRESPFLWSQERDARLSEVRWTANKVPYKLHRCASDSQMWILKRDYESDSKIYGLLIVYVDDFLLLTDEGPNLSQRFEKVKTHGTIVSEEEKIVHIDD
jgi:hypothetical protein